MINEWSFLQLNITMLHVDVYVWCLLLVIICLKFSKFFFSKKKKKKKKKSIGPKLDLVRRTRALSRDFVVRWELIR